MNFRFFIDDIEIEEPIGWDDFELSIKRDDIYHGMQFEASTGSLQFYGIAANYLRDKKNQNRLNNNTIFKAEVTCENIYEAVVEGRLNFGKYKSTCSNNGCFVFLPFEEDSCTVTFNNRFDQKVDLDNIFGLDNATVLPDYNQLGKKIRMPAKALQAAVDGSVSDDGFTINATHVSLITGNTFYFRPDYDIERYNNIKTGQLTGGNNCISNGSSVECPGPISPQLLFEDVIECFNGNFDYNVRYKGSINITGSVGLFNIKMRIFKWDATGDITSDSDIDIIQEVIIFDGLPTPPTAPITKTFDNTLIGTTTIGDNIGLYAVISIGLSTGNANIDINFDKETSFTLSAIRICPDTSTDYYMIHESLSRIVESVTNKCIRVKSKYYGRLDSQPFSFDQDGCGSLRFLTSGLKLRNAPNGKFFISPKDLISGLNAIDNIGFDIIDDSEIPGRSILRIEKIDEFYLNNEILKLENIALVTNEVQESMHYAKIQVGYKKWEVQQINGLNEFNSNREYRTNIETISTVLDITSILIAGSYPIELTRIQNFADSGAADTTYDSETFIVCVERNAYDFIVEQNKVLNPANIFDPSTILNFRLSPIRNLMRWFKSIINSYPSINGSAYRLFFNSGTANFIAAGQLNDNTNCRLENGVLNENDTIGILNFSDTSQAIPLYENETDTFDYPLSIAQYKQIKSNPYGYISYTCGNDIQFKKGFIKEIKFKPARGMANFVLIKKWNQ